MTRLEISLLGSPKIKLDGKLITGLPAKAQALLAYLVVTKQQQTRERLAEMLFSVEIMSREKKLDNLRGPGALLALNKVLSEFVESPKFSVAFKTESDYWLDVDEFQDCLRTPNPTPEQLQRAVDLYQGDFLTGLRLKEAEGFEEWAEQVRRTLEPQIFNALYLLAVHYKKQRQYAAALACITRLLALNPYTDEAHRELMLLLALTNHINEACSHYERYEALLANDGMEPESETTALYRKIGRGEIPADEESLLPLSSPPPKTWTPPFQAPPLLPHFVGREELREAICASLQTGDAVGIEALVGMGGVGKSSLAGEIAHALQEHFDDGVLWASVAVSEPTAVLESWAQAYGYDFSRLTDLESMANAFRGALADKRVLLVLDDVVSVSRIRPLLPNSPHCRVLLTTRDQDLAHALDAQVWRLGELSAADGHRLLAHILGEERIVAEPEVGIAICYLLQNLPLAVEIIGQRLRSRPRRQLADVVQRLRDEKQRLSELKISDRAVRASFAISYDTLDTQERQMFALMGLFHGRSFAADLMAGIVAQDRYETEDQIFALVALSLAQEDGATRYRQHPLLADFAREKLAESGEEGVWYGRLAHTYLTFAQQHQHDYDALRPEW
ncbi:MAG TPA: NB-ARC domain-containing protein, partial [Chloroflexota bacterium]|nr:NB-ARC domain-containing protein [Chloroflexota bacterium]